MNSPPDDLVALRDQIRAWAADLGFSLVGFAPAVPPPGYPHYLNWLQNGHHAGMAYMQRQAPARELPDSILPDVATVIVTALNYKPVDDFISLKPDNATGKIAAYARGDDYHQIFWSRLDLLLQKIQSVRPEVIGRAVADSAPLMERDYARLAGLGWLGKNTCLINRQVGSFTLLGSLLINLHLPPDEPFIADHCGSCTRCLDACPTDAFAAPGQLDARKCISYWTIEHKGPFPDDFAFDLDGWLFGCDICQQVCPWNRKPPAGTDPQLQPRPDLQKMSLHDWLKFPPDEIKTMIKGSPLERAKRFGLLRNAIELIVQNSDFSAIPDLTRLAELDPDEKVRLLAQAAIRKMLGQENKIIPD